MKLVIRRGATVEFNDLPPRSVALDGYVQGPEVDLVQERFSFDHHDRCLRLVTRATCQQVLDSLLLGFDPSDKSVFLNDIDGDTVLAVWLLKNPTRVTEKKVRHLVESVGEIDAHGPAYPALDPALADAFYQGAMREESTLRRSGEYQNCDLEALLNSCLKGVDDLLDGSLKLPESSPSLPYEITHTGTGGWVMVEGNGPIFMDLYQAGFTRIITHRPLEVGGWQYTVAKKSDLVPCFAVGPMSKPGTILATLADLEPGWGGGSSIGGSPRHEDGSSSKLSPEEVFQLVEGLVTQWTQD